MLVLGKLRAGKDMLWGNFLGLNIFCAPVIYRLSTGHWVVSLNSYVVNKIFGIPPTCLIHNERACYIILTPEICCDFV